MLKGLTSAQKVLCSEPGDDLAEHREVLRTHGAINYPVIAGKGGVQYCRHPLLAVFDHYLLGCLA